MSDKKMSTKLTADALAADGWVRVMNDPSVFSEKKIENRSPLNASEDSDIKLIVHGMYNSNNFAIRETFPFT